MVRSTRWIAWLLVAALLLGLWPAAGFTPARAWPKPVAATPTRTPEPTTVLPEPTPELPREREVQVTALAYRQGRRGVEGSAHPVLVQIKRKDKPRLRVGFFDTEVGGTGPMWRASGWTGVTFSALLLGINPELFDFMLDAGGGWVDGPSAGALTTVGILAALLGDPVREDAAMTGTINPDGTIGPVGGIPHKLEGAAQAGKKLVLVPAGQRYDLDENLGEQVDLVKYGRRLGLEVQPVSNVFEAYEVFTGKPLPRPQPTSRAEMPARAFDKYEAAARFWLSRYAEARHRFNSLSPEAQAEREPIYGDQQAQLAEQALEQGLATVAYQRALEAAFDAETSLQAATLDELWLEEETLDPLVEQVNAARASQETMEAVAERLAAESPRTVADAIALMDAWSEFAVAWGDIVNGDEALQQAQADPTADDALDKLYEAAYYYTVAAIELELARQSAEIGLGFGTSPMPSTTRLRAMADLLRRAGDANLELFESVVVEPLAEQAGLPCSQAPLLLAAQDGLYDSVRSARIGYHILKDIIWEEPAASLLSLGTALHVWSGTTTLIAKYYSLGARMDEEGTIQGFRRERSLVDMLRLADARAQELIDIAAAEEPVLPLFYYEVGQVWRQGDPEEQLWALNYHWQAIAEAQVMAYFAGFYGEAVLEELERTGRPRELLEFWDLPVQP